MLPVPAVTSSAIDAALIIDAEVRCDLSFPKIISGRIDVRMELSDRAAGNESWRVEQFGPHGAAELLNPKRKEKNLPDIYSVPKV